MRGGVVAVATSPAIDRISLGRGGVAEGIVRATETLETAGGKAVHAAMVARALGARTHLVAPAGGRRGELLSDLLDAEGIESTLVAVEAETRATHTLVDADLGDLVEIHDPPAALAPGECDALIGVAREKTCFASVAVIAGGLPPGAPPDLHARLVTHARACGAFTIVDSSSPEALELALFANPDLVKPNVAELSALLGEAATPDPDAQLAVLAGLAERLRERGAGAVWLSLGRRGSILASDAGVFHFNAPGDAVVNAVGCGDALAGGLAAGIARGLDLPDAAALGVAAAADKLGRLHSGRVESTGVERLLARVERVPVPAEAAVRR
jgi:1-phosphofructokinase family hexose kinase